MSCCGDCTHVTTLFPAVSGNRGCAQGNRTWDVPRHLIRWLLRQPPSSVTAVWHHDNQGTSDGYHETRHQPTGHGCTCSLLLRGDGGYLYFSQHKNSCCHSSSSLIISIFRYCSINVHSQVFLPYMFYHLWKAIAAVAWLHLFRILPPANCGFHPYPRIVSFLLHFGTTVKKNISWY